MDEDVAAEVVGSGAVVLCSVLGVVVAIAGIAGLVMLVMRQQQRQIAAWRAFAQARGLGMTGNWPDISLHGALDGASFSMRAWREGSGKHTHHYYEIAVPLARPLGDLSVTQEGLFQKLGKVFGGEDIQLGDPDFDPRWIVRTSQPAFAHGVLTPQARGALTGTLAALNHFGGHLGLYDSQLHWRVQGFARPEELTRVVGLLATAARAFAS